MWLSGQQKRPVDWGEGQTGIVTMCEDETAVLLESERRGLEIYSPGGYQWTPRVDHRVMVIRGQGEIPAIVGVRQGSERPGSVDIDADEIALEGDQMTVITEADTVIEAKNVRLKGQVYIKEERLEKLIERIVRLILAGGRVE